MLPDARDKNKVLDYLLGLRALVFEFHCRVRKGGYGTSNSPEINLVLSGNDQLYEYVERDISIVNQAIADNNPEIRFLNTYVLPPIDIPYGLTDKSLFENLLEEKYIDGNEPQRYTDKKQYAAYEAIRFKNQYEGYFDFLPVSKQWFEYLKDIADGKESKEDQIIEVVATDKDFTTARQVLAIHFILEQLQVRSNEVDRKAKAELSQFLTGKNYKNIYDAFQNPFTTKQKNFRFDDLQYIRPFFEKLGLSEIVKAINNQLDKPR